MTGKNIQERFENFISSLSIPKYIRVDLQRAVLKLVENLKKVGNPIIFPIQQTRSKNRSIMVLRGHQFGGSYDRGTFVKNVFDIDVYVVYTIDNMNELITQIKELKEEVLTLINS